MTSQANEAAAIEAMRAQLEAMSAQLAYLVERQRRTDALIADAGPILKAVMGTAIERLDVLDRKGYFAFGRELLGVGDRLLEHFSPDDVRQLGDAAGAILDTVRELTQPEVLRVMSDAAEVLRHADDAEPIGLLGMVRATRDHEVQRGMATMMEVLRHVGRAATIAKEQRHARPLDEKRAKLEAALGSRKKRATEAAPSKPASAPVAAPTLLDGVAFGPDGHMLDAAAWTRELGERIAAMQGVDLTGAHWQVIDFARADFEANHMAPNVRRITQQMGVSTRDLYALFPKAPGRTIAKIAGLPKPAGCL